jgi:hypothetical protein
MVHQFLLAVTHHGAPLLTIISGASYGAPPVSNIPMAHPKHNAPYVFKNGVPQ